MDKNSQKRLLDVLNSSGFPFQIGLRKEMERTVKNHGWTVDIGEHRWTHRNLQKSGYIDLIASHNQFIFTILIECKRMREGNWVFLTPEGSSHECSRLSAFYTVQGTNNTNDLTDDSIREISFWSDLNFTPISHEAEFCVIKGQDERNPMLERISDELLPAVEAVGLEYLALNAKAGRIGGNRLFLPVIITNSELWKANFDPSNINLKSGEIEANKCNFERVPFIRFRKSLSTHFPSHRFDMKYRQGSLEEAAKGNERTILVINSQEIGDTLTKLGIPQNQRSMLGQELASIVSELHKK